MDLQESCSQACSEFYIKCFNANYIYSLDGRQSQAARNNAERDAQRIAIKETLKFGLLQFPGVEAKDIWNNIYITHLKRKANLTSLNTIDEEIIARVISADQSWKKSSGHAFEGFIPEIVNPKLESSGIKFLLQRDIHFMLERNEIHNDPTDTLWIKQKISTDVFDLYAVLTYLGKNIVYGCIQSKTSIRDRVTRDREPSIQAMEQKFWSIAIVLDGAFLALPKYQEMVNGKGNDYNENGWHGLYVMSDKYTKGRIYPVNKDFTLLIDHARKAALSWSSARQRFTNNWKP